MSGPVNNPFSSRKRAMAFNNQSAPGTPVTLTSADCVDVSSCSYAPRSRTSEDPRYTGTIDRPGDQMVGVSWDVTFEWLIHGFSGAVPAANAFLPGRILQAWGFTENRLATAIGPEALSIGTTTGATLGTTAAGTANLYKGYAINLASIGATPAGLAMIQAYTAGKVATFARTRAVPTGNYTIPAQLAYTLATTEPDNPSSITVWDGDNGGSGRRMNFVDMRPTAASIELVTSSRDGGASFCKISGTFSGDLGSEVAEAAPVVSTSIAIPPFLNGQQDIAQVQLGGSSISIDLGIGSGYPPNPNQISGSDPGLVTARKKTVSMNLNAVRQSVIDFNALALAQTSFPLQALWGLNPAGNYMGLMVDSMRFDYRTPAEGQDFLTTSGNAWIDGVDRAIALTFLA